MIDVTVRDEGTIFLVTPQTEVASVWIEDHVSGESTYFGRSLVVEHRYIRDLAIGMAADGLSVEWEN